MVYPLHPACWDIFCQQFAAAVVRNPLGPDLDCIGAVFAAEEVEEEGRGFKPDWTADYAGAENFWSDGWSWNEDVEASEVKQTLDESPDLDFIVFDPQCTSLPANLIQHPPLMSTDRAPSISWPTRSGEPFSKLPVEILHIIMRLLPTPSVLALRLASRIIASVPLANSFWHSRFDVPHELCHVDLSKLLASHEANVPIDWKTLRERLLNSHGPDAKGWQNRKRINQLATRLVHRILNEDDESLDRRAKAPQNK